MRISGAATVFVLGVLAAPTSSHAIYGDSDDGFEINGSLRQNFFASKAPELDFTNSSESELASRMNIFLLRLNALGQPSEWLSYEVHGLSTNVFNTGSDSVGALFAPTNNAVSLRYRLFDGQYTLGDQPDFLSTVSLERSNLSIFLPFADIVIGRQALSFGKALFWNPLDVFRPFDPTQFDRDYKSGIDALRIYAPIGDDLGITVIGTGSHEDANYDLGSWYGSSIIGRLEWTTLGWDIAFQGGKIFGGYQVGAAASGELFEIPVRAEAAYFRPEQGDAYNQHVSLVLGTGYRFENTLHIEFEYFYNGAATAVPIEAQRERLAKDSRRAFRSALEDPGSFCAANPDLIPEGLDCETVAASILEDDALVTSTVDSQIGSLSNDQVRQLSGFAHGMGEGRLLNTSEHLAGIMLSYEIVPVLTGSLSAISSLSDQSTIIQPGLSWSITDEADVFVGGIISVGKRATDQPDFCAQLGGCPQTEFGTYPHVFYLQAKLYF